MKCIDRYLVLTQQNDEVIGTIECLMGGTEFRLINGDLWFNTSVSAEEPLKGVDVDFIVDSGYHTKEEAILDASSFYAFTSSTDIEKLSNIERYYIRQYSCVDVDGVRCAIVKDQIPLQFHLED